MKKFPIIFLLFLFLNSFCLAKNIKFIQVTDVHFDNNNAASLSQFVDDVNVDFKDVDFVVFTGDNLAKPDSSYLWNFLEIVKKIKPKTYILTGDRDLFEGKGVSKSNYMYLVKKRLGFYHSSKPNYVFKKNNIVFVVMNGVKEFFPVFNGYFQHDELVWLNKTLKKYKNKKVVILQHFPLIDSNIESTNLYRKNDYLDVLKSHNNVIAVVSGHYHDNREENIDNIKHIVTQKFDDNRYYKVIEIDEKDSFIYTSLIDNTL